MHIKYRGQGQDSALTSASVQVVGWPVAMSNAVPQVKAVCKAETLSNDDGLLLPCSAMCCEGA